MKRITLCIFWTLALAGLLYGADQRGKLKATPCGTQPHCTVLTWTNPTFVAGGYVSVFKGSTSGGESSTPINPTGTQVTTFTDLNVVANGTAYYTVEQCAVSNSSGGVVCSPASNEVKAVTPLAPSDLSAPVSLTGSAN